MLFVQSRAPHGSLFGQEGLDAILMGTAFAECSVLLLDDAVYQVLDDQDTRALGTRNYSVTYGALKDYGVDTVYCCAADLDERGLTTADLLIPVSTLDDDGVRDLLARHQVIFSF